MSLQGFNEIGQAFDDGRFHNQFIYKVTTPVPGTAGFFVDLNQSAGVPKYNAFAGSSLTATSLVGSGNNGIYPGNYISGRSKYLQRWQMQDDQLSSGAPDYIYLSDYLLFYPLIDCDDVDIQFMDNAVTLPRYASGEGVQIVLIATAPIASTASLTITYVNSDGVSGRTSTANIIPAASIGVCATGSGLAGSTGQVTPFWPLATGDKGVRAIESIQFASGAGGFICACLVRPLATLQTYEAQVPVEKYYGFDNQKMPEILEGAYLNFLIQRSNISAGNFKGELIFINI